MLLNACLSSALRTRCIRSTGTAHRCAGSLSSALDEVAPVRLPDAPLKSASPLRAQAELLMRIAHKLDKKTDRSYEGRPAFTDVDFAPGNLDHLTQTADFQSDNASKCFCFSSIFQLQGRAVEIVYTNEVGSINRWIQRHVFDNRATVVGLDTEQRPSFWSKNSHRGGHGSQKSLNAQQIAAINACSVLQLACADSVLVAHVAHLQMDTTSSDFSSDPVYSDARHPVGYSGVGAPGLLLQLLQQPGTKFVGVNVAADYNAVMRCFQLRPSGASDGSGEGSGVVDIDKLARALGIRRSSPGMCHGLESLGHKLMGLPRWKTGALSLSNWNHIPLSPRQVRYAAMDAWAGLLIFQYLTTSIANTTSSVIETQQKMDGAYRYLWVHDIAMLPTAKGVSTAWLKKRSVAFEDFGTSILSKSPYPRLRNGKLVLPSEEECRTMCVNSPFLVPTFRTRLNTNNSPEMSLDAGGPETMEPSAPGNDNFEPPVQGHSVGEFWQSDRMHPAIRYQLEFLNV